MDREIIFGIRPENIVLAGDLSEANDRYVPFATNVRLAEMLGSETLIHFMLDNQNIIAKVNTLEEFTRNQDLTLAFDLEFANFFDKDSTDRIVLDNEKNYQNITRGGGSASGKSDKQYDQSNQSDRTHSQTHSFQASK